MSYMDLVLSDQKEMAKEAQYRVKWLEEHKDADEAFYDEKTKMPVKVVYYYPPLQHYQENQKFWNDVSVESQS